MCYFTQQSDMTTDMTQSHMILIHMTTDMTQSHMILIHMTIPTMIHYLKPTLNIIHKH